MDRRAELNEIKEELRMIEKKSDLARGPVGASVMFEAISKILIRLCNIVEVEK